MFWQWIFSGGDREGDEKQKLLSRSSGMNANKEENPYFKHNKPSRKGSKISKICKCEQIPEAYLQLHFIASDIY